ncbi:MAG: transcription termination/antitermination protein NusA [Dehalococcoidia bacterium]|nr:transcription termination/antitermination protein NusA [Dehalococcoidia bacterium]
MKSDFVIALTQLAAERHLPREQVLQAIEAALASALKKDNLAVGQNISVKLNPNSTGDPISVFATKTVVEDVEDIEKEILLLEARKIKKDAALGEEVPVESLQLEFSRIAAQTAKQVVLQRLREVERDLIFQEFMERTNDVMSGVVEQMESGRVIVLEMGRAQAVLPPEEQVLTERYKKGQRLKIFVLDVRKTAKGPEILVSRSHKDLLKRLFEIEVPEVFNGMVEIKSIAREAGSRSKVAVAARQEGIDPVGSCIGMRGNRIQSIVNELQGEKIDVVRWDKDIKTLISNALSPSEVIHVEMDKDGETALVVVPERQLSLAIGKEGQNARLAARLTGFRLDIKSMVEWEAIKAHRQADDEAAARAAARAKLEVAVAQPENGLAELEEAEPVLVEAQAESPYVEEVVEEVLEPVLADSLNVEVEEEAVLEPQAMETEEEDVVEEVSADSGLSPEEELALLAIEDEAEEEADEDEEEEGTEDASDDVWNVPVAPSNAGQIRFAEDIMGEFRGRGRRAGKGRRGTQDDAWKGKKGGSRGRRAPRPKSGATGATPARTEQARQ